MERRYTDTARKRVQSAECEMREKFFGIDGIDLVARSLCDSERDATMRDRDALHSTRVVVVRRISAWREPVVTYAANTRPSLLPQREKSVRAREDRKTVRWFVKELPPRPSKACFWPSEKEGGTLRSYAQESNTREHTLCRSPAPGAAVRAYTRARGQADRRANLLQRLRWKEKASTDAMKNYYPERWITWLVGR